MIQKQGIFVDNPAAQASADEVFRLTPQWGLYQPDENDDCVEMAGDSE